ncbi:hypothetical protein Desca_0971 [Desulfotomaculum nigrificans CO-1-SRB]|uniref:Transcription factor zinc-finger domain-containing protein n=1 Tax=Desulfotomaculum nigrificans (strain DSM 14880 / VKM B-2319 / CO-1-SRB) TaxID=868595 RepID=F6B2L7_DESCC|nr:zf-TFIIB domain-containing protein [Desulfotomaculum nigrificans]AEF93846.1 hypothetical protein Desca_0971 [Desulfotomaculum nigrificans CO-1-SRB]
MICPACSAEMRQARKEGVIIDVCPSCRGIWLDHGELEKIIERSREALVDYDELYDHDHHKHYDHDDHKHYGHHGYKHGKHYKKKHSIFSIFEDIFD